ncbi:MAG: hypothetical protein IPP51_10045 [Bacteroidetes bacterium]|nr:hypothetical protein [Bacteroidota bacterium]
MKTKAILALVVAGTLSFSACTKKIDPKTVADINQFGTDWTAMGEKATAWSTEMAQTTTQAKEFAAKQAERMNSMTSSKDEAMKTQMATMVQSSNENVTKLENMQNEWNTFKATWDATTTQFSEWKDKVTKGEVTPEDAAKGLADFQSKMSDASNKIQSWTTSYAEIKTATEQNMASAEPVTTQPEAKTKK